MTSKSQKKKNLKKKRNQALKAHQARQSRGIEPRAATDEFEVFQAPTLTSVLDHEPEPDLEHKPAPEPTPEPVLATETGPIQTDPTEQAPPRRRRGAWVVAACVGALLAAGAAGVVLLDSGPSSTPTHAALSAATFDSPVPLAPGTAYVETKVLPSGDLVVTHWIHSRKDLYAVTLDVPSLAGLPTSDVAVSHLMVAGDGKVLSEGGAGLSRSDATSPRSPLVLPGVRHLYVTYELSGVMERDSTVADRGLARLTALTVSTDAHLTRVTATVSGARVLAMACSAATPAAVPVPCGQAQDGTWSVQLDRRNLQDRVMAQFDLS